MFSLAPWQGGGNFTSAPGSGVGGGGEDLKKKEKEWSLIIISACFLKTGKTYSNNPVTNQ